MKTFYYKLETNIESITCPVNTTYVKLTTLDVQLKLYPINDILEFNVSDTFSLKQFSKEVSLLIKFFDVDNIEIGTQQNHSFTAYNSFVLDYQSIIDLQNHRLMVDTPYWDNYPFTYVSGKLEVIHSPGTVPINHKLQDDLCEGVYLKFLNQYGYYSYFLFNNNSKEIIKKSNGATINDWSDSLLPKQSIYKNKIETESTIKTIVNKKYYPIISQIALSREVYVYINNKFAERESEITMTKESNQSSLDVTIKLTSLKSVYNAR